MANYLVKKSNVPTIHSVWLEGLKPLRLWKPRHTKNKEDMLNIQKANYLQLVQCLNKLNLGLARVKTLSDLNLTSKNNEKRGCYPYQLVGGTRKM